MNLNFRPANYFRFRSDLYIRDSGETTAFPCVWPCDHRRGRFYATYLARTCHYWCRIGFPSRPLRSGLALPEGAVSIAFAGNTLPADNQKRTVLASDRHDLTVST